MNYLDANFATALHFNIQRQTDLAERFVRRTSLPLVFSELAELECRRAFALRTGVPASENWNRLQGLLADGLWQRAPLDWSLAAEKAGKIIDRYGASLSAGTLDTLHVALALLSGCTWFLSFDTHSNARTLAASCRLRVFPDLIASEKARLQR